MIKVIIVEDNDTIRKGLEVIINNSLGFSCIAGFSNCDSMLKKIKDLCPDILLIDINLPGMNGIEGIKKVKSIFPELAILVLLIYKESEKLFEAVCSGACGYVEKNSPPSTLLNSIRIAYKGGAVMSAQIALKIQELIKKSGYELTSTEKSALDALISGNNYKAIASNLSLSIDSVQKQFRNIYKKIHFNQNGNMKF
jgi:DNA-binding NarL/FixJ family response regulator